MVAYKDIFQLHNGTLEQVLRVALVFQNNPFQLHNGTLERKLVAVPSKQTNLNFQLHNGTLERYVLHLAKPDEDTLATFNSTTAH